MIGLTRGVALGASFNRFVEIFGQYDNDEDGGKNNRVEHGFRADHLEKTTGGKNPRLFACVFRLCPYRLLLQRLRLIFVVRW